MARLWLMKRSYLKLNENNMTLCAPKLILQPKYNKILHGLITNYTTHYIHTFTQDHMPFISNVITKEVTMKYTKLYNNIPLSYYCIFNFNHYDLQQFICNPVFWHYIYDENISNVENISLCVDVFNEETNEQIGFCTTNFDLSIDTIR